MNTVELSNGIALDFGQQVRYPYAGIYKVGYSLQLKKIAGTNATVDQTAKDVTTFLTWAAEPHLEARHKTGTKVIIYLILLATLVYLSMKKLWSRVDTEK
jgi:ubiquinol-cytochrome c reductase cytochrome c1 subunit